MKAVITGDIVSSRKLINQDIWLQPLKQLLNTWGARDKDWRLERGDYFQIEVADPSTSLKKALEIKALIKQCHPIEVGKKFSTIDVRMAIGIGQKTFNGETIAENNGSAYIFSGESYELLKKDHTNIRIKSPWNDFDEEMNVSFLLASTIIDHWTMSSAELMQTVLAHPMMTQEGIGNLLGIKQNSVSGRWNRAHVSEILLLEKLFSKKVKALLS
jgi:hypothetical protein